MNKNYNLFGRSRDTLIKSRLKWLQCISIVILLFSNFSMQSQGASSYGFLATTGTYANVSGTATALPTLLADDAISASQSIGFTFVYEGANYTQFKASSNGILSLNPTGTVNLATNDFATANATSRPILAALWDDQDGRATGGSYAGYETTGSVGSRVFTMEWRNWEWNWQSTAPVISYQIKLYETTNVIEFIYRTESGTYNPGSTGGASIGIGSATGSGSGSYLNITSVASPAISSSTSVTNLTIRPATGTLYRFTPPVPCTGTPTPGTIPATAGFCNGSSAGASLAATGYTTGVSGITFQWEESDDNGAFDTWTNAVGGSGATTATYTTPVLATSRYYRLKVTCSGTDAFTNSSLVSVINCSYDVTKSSLPYTSIATTGTSLTGWRNGNATDDNLSTSQPIGFTFNYKGATYSNFSASTNGFLTFNVGTSVTGGALSGPYSYDNATFTTSGSAGSILTLAPFYEDLVTPGNPATLAGLNAALKYQIDGVAPNRVATIEWIGMETFNNAGPNLNFQIKLHETTGVIEYNYGTFEQFNGTSVYGYSYTVGVNGATMGASPTIVELQSQQVDNVQNFSNTAQNVLKRFMDCNTRYTFTPGSYSGASAAPALVNDEPSSALTLSVNSAPCTSFCGTYYTSNGATASAGIAVCGAGTPGTPDDDVWFKFVATTSSQTITVRGAGLYNAVLQLFSDAGITSINCVNATAAGFTETISATGLVLGGTYYVRVYHAATGASVSPDFSICINEIVPPPANDTICGAVSLSVNTSCANTAGSTLNSTASPEAVCGGTADDDVWYSFIALSSSDIVTVQSGAGFNAHLQILSSSDNTCTGTLASLGCINATSTAGSEVFAGTSLVPGNRYFIRVYHTTSGTGTGAFTICVTATAPSCITNPTTPTNGGTVCDAAPVTLSFPAAAGASSYSIVVDGAAPVVQSGTSYNAGVLGLGLHTWSVTPSNAVGSASGCSDWTFTVEAAPVAGTISGPSTLFTAQTGSFNETAGSGGALQWRSSTVPGGPYSNIAGATTNPANISFATPGTYYVVLTRTVNGCAGANSNEIQVVVSVQGDTPCAPIALVVGSNGPFSNAGATGDVGEVVPPGNGCAVQTGWCNNSGTVNSIWGTFVAPASGRVSILSGNFDTQLALYSATNCNDYSTFTLIAANDDNGPDGGGSTNSSFISAKCLIPGNTYYVLLDGYNATTGATTIVITEVALVVPTFAAVPANCSGTIAALPTTSTNAISGTWSPAINQDVTTLYTFTPNAGQCAAATTLTITVPSTTWSGTAWSDNAPDAATVAIFEGDFTSTADLTACRLVVSNGADVTVASGHDFNITNAVRVAAGGTLTFENNANLLQDPATVPNNNIGDITYKRNAAMHRSDYVFWSSPVLGQQLQAFSEETLPNRFYTISEATNLYVPIDPTTDFVPAHGYVIRAPNTFPANGNIATFNGEFFGAPNNGTYSLPITNSGAGKGFNIMGNPYPSTVNADAFLATNPGTLYFWAHASLVPANGNNFASYNGAGAAAAAGGAVPNGFIQAGQGFLLKPSNASTEAIFTNNMRAGNNAGQFFRTANTIERNRIWLNLSTPERMMNQTLVSYMTGATEGVDGSLDGLLNYSGSSISSIINEENYVIQGRSLPFATSDEVALNFKAEVDGTFILSIDHVDGLFEGDQDVFLKDNLTGVVHNIKEGAYTFASVAGSFANRFAIVYQAAPLAVDTPVVDANSVVVFKNNNVLNINSGKVTMSGVKVFDMRGRMIFQQSEINATTAVLNGLRAEQQVLLVQITSNDNKIITKKVVY